MKDLLDSIVNEPSPIENIFMANFGNSAAQHVTRLLPEGVFIAAKCNYTDSNSDRGQKDG